VSAGAKFCNQCGSAVSGGAAVAHKSAAVAAIRGKNLPWWIAGAAMFGLIMVLGLSMVQPGSQTGEDGTAAGTGSVAPGNPPDITQMTPIEAATRLFNRVMSAVSAGDSTEAQAFLPMAIAAYERARPLDHDGLFHLSMLNRSAQNLEAALANALEVLEEDPNHLLALAAAAEAAIELGLTEDAARHYTRIQEIYDVERTRGLEEYDMHSAIVSVLKQDAERYLAGR
jgi:tetratricopeptide (TPR) repeat protein